MVSVLHTNTIAVHGAAPSKTAPARYSVARSGVIKPLKTINKNRATIPYIVKGLISQFTIQVRNNPFGFLPTCFTLRKSTFIIIGYIITQIRIAIGIDIPEISSLPSLSGIAGINRPINTPTSMQPSTHHVRFF